MSYIGACLAVLFSMLVAGGAGWLVCRAIKLDSRRKHHDVGSALFLQLGVLFAVLLAFVFNEVWAEYNLAAEAINGECGALHGAAMLARTLPSGQGQAVRGKIAAYASIVVDVEWPALAHRQSSVQATEAFRSALESAAQVQVSRASDMSTQAQVVSLLTQAHAFRETRIFQANQGLPMVLWVALGLSTAVLVGLMLFAGVESVLCHAVLAGVFAGSLVLVLVMLRMLDYPFEGALALDPGDFQKTISLIATESSAP